VSQVTAGTRRPPQQTRRQPGRAGLARRRARWHRVARWAFLAPAVAYVLFAFAIPVVYNLVLSFEQTSPATVSHLTAPFAGWSNYTTTLKDPVADSAIVRTFSFTVLSLLFQFLIGFGLALLFSLRFPLSRFARSLVLVPCGGLTAVTAQVCGVQVLSRPPGTWRCGGTATLPRSSKGGDSRTCASGPVGSAISRSSVSTACLPICSAGTSAALTCG
jgi:hypothetical protein